MARARARARNTRNRISLWKYGHAHGHAHAQVLVYGKESLYGNMGTRTRRFLYMVKEILASPIPSPSHSLAGHTHFQGEWVWSNSHLAFVLHDQQ